jgi:hypothetical protein
MLHTLLQHSLLEVLLLLPVNTLLHHGDHLHDLFNHSYQNHKLLVTHYPQNNSN